MIESLEQRKLLAVTANFASGVLTVTGDEHSNAVLIGINDHGQIFVHSDHHVILAVDAHHVTSIQVDLGAGNDSLDTSLHVKAPMTIHGGDGNDTLVGGSGHDVVSGDEGDDVIRVRDGHTDLVDGGHGNDIAYVDHGHIDQVVNVEHTIFPEHNHHDDHHHQHVTAAMSKLLPLHQVRSSISD